MGIFGELFLFYPRLTTVITLDFIVILPLQALHVLLALKEPLTVSQVTTIPALFRDAQRLRLSQISPPGNILGALQPRHSLSIFVADDSWT